MPSSIILKSTFEHGMWLKHIKMQLVIKKMIIDNDTMPHNILTKDIWVLPWKKPVGLLYCMLSPYDFITIETNENTKKKLPDKK